jgi:hypothetical protein
MKTNIKKAHYIILILSIWIIALILSKLLFTFLSKLSLYQLLELADWVYALGLSTIIIFIIMIWRL